MNVQEVADPGIDLRERDVVLLEEGVNIEPVFS